MTKRKGGCGFGVDADGRDWLREAHDIAYGNSTAKPEVGHLRTLLLERENYRQNVIHELGGDPNKDVAVKLIRKLRGVE
jgi:hypothetical protein